MKESMDLMENLVDCLATVVCVGDQTLITLAASKIAENLAEIPKWKFVALDYGAFSEFVKALPPEGIYTTRLDDMDRLEDIVSYALRRYKDDIDSETLKTWVEYFSSTDHVNEQMALCFLVLDEKFNGLASTELSDGMGKVRHFCMTFMIENQFVQACFDHADDDVWRDLKAMMETLSSETLVQLITGADGRGVW
jgi:hypothetical protein